MGWCERRGANDGKREKRARPPLADRQAVFLGSWGHVVRAAASRSRGERPLRKRGGVAVVVQSERGARRAWWRDERVFSVCPLRRRGRRRTGSAPPCGPGGRGGRGARGVWCERSAWCKESVGQGEPRGATTEEMSACGAWRCKESVVRKKRGQDGKREKRARPAWCKESSAVQRRKR